MRHTFRPAIAAVAALALTLLCDWAHGVDDATTAIAHPH
jgi:hypothetical protein